MRRIRKWKGGIDLSIKQQTIIGWAILLTVTAVLCFLFIPQKRQETIQYQAVQISSDGQILNECTFRWDATTKKKRLQKEAHYNYIHLTVSNLYDFNTSMYNNDTFSFYSHPDADHEITSFTFSLKSANDWCHVTVIRSLDRQWCILSVKETSEKIYYFIGTADPDMDPMEIYQEYPTYFQ